MLRILCDCIGLISTVQPNQVQVLPCFKNEIQSCFHIYLSRTQTTPSCRPKFPTMGSTLPFVVYTRQQDIYEYICTH